jgi:PIN domain nuclease of toxin-antitoxin system
MTEKAHFLLDTHAAIWLQLEPTRPGPHARSALTGIAPE